MNLGNGLTVQLSMHSLLPEGCRQVVAAGCTFSASMDLNDGHAWCLASVSIGFDKSKIKWGADDDCFFFLFSKVCSSPTQIPLQVNIVAAPNLTLFFLSLIFFFFSFFLWGGGSGVGSQSTTGSFLIIFAIQLIWP